MKLTILLLGLSMSIQAATPLDIEQVWNFNDAPGTETKFRALLPEIQKSKNLDHELQILTQIARTLGLQRKFEEAHVVLNDVEKRLNDKTPVAAIRYNLERGRVWNSSKKKAEATPFFIKAHELAAQAKQDNLNVDALHMVAIAEADANKQMEWNLKAVKTAEVSTDTKANNWLGSLYNNIGWTYHDQGQFNEALDMFKKALAFRESKKTAPSIRVAKWCIARTYRSLQRYDEALKLQKEIEPEEQDGYVFEELGELYLVLKNKAESKKYFSLAYEKLVKDEWFKANEAKRLERIKQLSL
jgi:tetratricopeptide (TPR) repeat protein